MRKITLEENKKLLVEMLVELSKYFNKNDIKYFLGYGTLLGAVRHKGFIPWDDDIDLLVPRDDFIKLIHLLEKDKEYLALKNLELLEFNNRPKSYHKRFKIANTQTFMEEYGEIRSAVFIDVFPLDCFRSSKDAKKKLPIVKLVSNLLTFCHARKVYASGIKGFIYKVVFFVNKLFGLNRMERFYENCQLKLSQFNENGVVGCSEDEYDYTRYSDASNWTQSIMMEFEGKQFSCPKGYDSILRMWYGDYMSPPPVGERHAHESYVMYWKD